MVLWLSKCHFDHVRKSYCNKKDTKTDLVYEKTCSMEAAKIAT